MSTSLERELEEIVERLAPPFIDLDELARLVAIDDDPATFDGECAEHDACLPISSRR